MKTILFVCTGNVCRSPMAEGLFRQATRGRSDYRAISAGVGAMEGLSPSDFAVKALAERGRRPICMQSRKYCAFATGRPMSGSTMGTSR